MLYYTITKIRIISDNYNSLYDDFYFKRPVRFLKPDRSESTDKLLMRISSRKLDPSLPFGMTIFTLLILPVGRSL